MSSVNEVKMMKDGAMVTPVVVIDSIKNNNGSNFKDIFKYMNPTLNFYSDYHTRDNSIVKFTFPYTDLFKYYTAKYYELSEADAYEYLDTVTLEGEDCKCLYFKVNDLVYVTSIPYTKAVDITKTFTAINGFTLTYRLSGTITINSINDWSFNPTLTIKVTKNGYNTKLVDLVGNEISASKVENHSFEFQLLYDVIAVVVDFGKFYWGNSGNLCQLSETPVKFGIMDESLSFRSFSLDETLSLSLSSDINIDWYDKCVGIDYLIHHYSVTFTKT